MKLSRPAPITFLSFSEERNPPQQKKNRVQSWFRTQDLLRRRIKKIIAVSVFVFFFIFAAATVAAADFNIEKFSADIGISSDSAITVAETIDINFLNEQHGIYRNIPVAYQDKNGNNLSLHLNVISVKNGEGDDYQYKISKDGKNLQIKIGNPSRTIFGRNTYIIKYKVSRAINYFADHDELYWNVTGSDWAVPIDNVAAKVSLGFAVPQGGLKVACYTGALGSTAEDCSMNIKDNAINYIAHDFLTVVIGWPHGILVSPSHYRQALWFVQDNWIVALPVLVFIILLYLWWCKGRDVGGKKTIIAEYDPPDNLTSAEVGTLIDARVQPRDISSIIIDLAVRGYLKIKEVESQGILLKTKDWQFIKVKEEADLKEHEKLVMQGIFGSKSEANLSSLKSTFYKTRRQIENYLYQEMAQLGYFVSNPKTVRGSYALVGIGIAMLGFAFGSALGAAAIFSFVISGILFVLFSLIMSKKTNKGMLAYEKSLGLKEYISRAEKYRMEWQEKENIFERLLPYAVAFGVVKEWANNFQNIYKDPPAWYQGSFHNGFSVLYLASALDSFNHATSSMVAAPGAAQGGSGFGGGMSGGGFGGGGGGSW